MTNDANLIKDETNSNCAVKQLIQFNVDSIQFNNSVNAVKSVNYETKSN